MLTGFDIVVFSYADWYASQTTPHHLARIFSERNRVLFVDVPRSLLHFLKGRDPLCARAWKGPALQQVQPNLWVLHPPQVFLPTGAMPWPLARYTVALNGWLLAHMVRRAVHSIGLGRILLWSTSPLHAGAVARVPHAWLVHDICEEWVNFLKRPSDRRLFLEIDCALTREADIAFAFSEPMQHRRDGLNAEMHVVYPAGDVEFFEHADEPATQIPEEEAALPSPIIGAMCVVDRERFDIELMARIATTHPEWSIVVLGPVRKDVDLEPLRRFKNIRFLNPPRPELPAYLKGFAVALVPYRLTDAVKDTYPMKIQEYLAAGKPVVSPRLPVCAHLADVVHFADTHEDYIHGIEQALQEDSPDSIARRHEVARHNSWRHRVEERSHFVEELFASRATRHVLSRSHSGILKSPDLPITPT